MRIVSLFVLVILFFIAALYFGQRKLIFPAPGDDLPASLASDVQIIVLSQGRALLAAPTTSNAISPLIVFAHGNAEVAHWSIDEFQYLRALGYAILLLEYPGYAGTEGSPSADSIQAASLEAINQVMAREDIDPNRIIVYGRSIGTGVACQIATAIDVAALVLESPFSSLKRLVAEKGFPSLLLRDQFDNASVVAKLKIPVFIYHGTDDNIIPIHHSEQLASAAKNVVFHQAKCGHNDCPRPRSELVSFLNKNNFTR